MQTQHISKISVKALCNAADVHRSTFYAHYMDQYDLLRQITDEVLTNITSYLDEQDYDTKHPLSAQKLDRILQYAKNHADVFKALLSENSDIVIQRELMGFINAVSFPINIDESSENNKKKEYIVLFIINGCVSVLNKWMQDGMQEPTYGLSEFLLQILYNGIGSV
ncbi:hypothetical protein SDC9_172445 [bioreactor metagenome]|uniref:Transcriptional regulator TetR C-terminal Firmicutes type domain-containing protein n=1 Tax=bioreactor metagenome TaxID=1076179 RepID=A0A645GDR4_9ZZZZ